MIDFKKVAKEFGTPIYIYDETAIRGKARQLNQALKNIKGYKNYFAVKATPTPAILKILHEEGMGFDCSSRAELEMVKRLGMSGQEIFYTSNNTPKEDFELAISLNAIVNIDDLTQVPVFVEALAKRPYYKVAIRYNPGNLKQGNTIIGEPTEAKYGMKLEQLPQAVKLLQEAGAKEIGLHTMVASNELKAEYFVETAEILRDAFEYVKGEAGYRFDFINLGGGFGINYNPGEKEVNLTAISKGLERVQLDLDVPFVTENGRYLTCQAGYLVTKVRYIMEKHKNYIGVDASMHNLMRPGMYGAYHKITVLSKSHKQTEKFDVVGSLCENNDKFAIDRQLPIDIKPGDIMIIHDVGAHGHAMGFNYNGLLKSAEVLAKEDGSINLIRRAETVDDYFKTIIW